MIENGTIKKPTIRRIADHTLRHTEDGAFDIPTFIASVAIDYFSGSVSFEDAKSELYEGGHLTGGESDEHILNWLKESLRGNERFYEQLNEEMDMKIKNGKKYIFNTTDAELKKYNGTEVLVIRPLTDKECDIEDVGNMYKIKFADGYERDAFEDELSIIEA